jgi:hypothetical protein
MKTQVIYNSDLHFEHVHWKGELLFWKDEIKSFQNRLDELVNRWTDTDVLKQLSEYQNSFIIHKARIDEFIDRIDAHELDIAKHYEIHMDVIDIPDLKTHNKYRDEMETERSIYHELKKEFFKFLAKYM